MSLLRIRCALSASPRDIEWAVLDGGPADRGVGPLEDAPATASRVELVIDAGDVLIAHAQLPPSARRRGASTLAYAVEEQTLGDPETQHVSWLGRDGEHDVLAVVDRAALEQCVAAVRDKYGAPIAVYCETLLLPLAHGEWSLAWDGAEGFVRTGALAGAATDAGDAHTPPLSLKLMLDEAAARGPRPQSIAVYVASHDVELDLAAWQADLGVPLRFAGVWDAMAAEIADAARIASESGGGREAARIATRLKPAAWIVAAAFAIHGVALVADWIALTREQRELRARMEKSFRAAFPEAVAVVDPALQMRRKLADARHAASRSDESDFVPLVGHVAAALGDLPRGALRLVSYERGRLTLRLAAPEDASVQRIASRLRERGLRVEAEASAAARGERTIVVSADGA